MLEITGITTDYRQQFNITIKNYGYAQMTLQYKPNQLAWFFDLTWQNFAITNQQLTMSPNILRQYRKILPFGIACVSSANIDPIVIEAFVVETKLYLLDASDVLSVESSVYG